MFQAFEHRLAHDPHPPVTDRPAHHGPDGKYRIPWPLEVADARAGGGVLRWQLERLRTRLPPNPDPSRLPLVAPDVARPRAATGEIRITWIGHASFLLQMGGRNVLLDPHFGERASPLGFMGPKRFVPPGIALKDLPPCCRTTTTTTWTRAASARCTARLGMGSGGSRRWGTRLGCGRAA